MPGGMRETIEDTIEEVLEESFAAARLETPLRAVGISGSPRSPSKSRAAAECLLAALQRLGCEVRMIDLATMPAEALVARDEPEVIDDAMGLVGQAQIVVAASPTYRALYTGVLKCFFDLMPQGHLAQKVCVGVQTGIAAEHALSPDYGLRLLFASLEGVPAATVYATEAEFADGQPMDELEKRLGRAAEQAIQLAHGLGPGEA